MGTGGSYEDSARSSTGGNGKAPPSVGRGGGLSDFREPRDILSGGSVVLPDIPVPGFFCTHGYSGSHTGPE
jgi:hypothetical protein